MAPAVRLPTANQFFFTAGELFAWLELERRRRSPTADIGILDRLHDWASEVEAAWTSPAMFTVRFISPHAAHVTFRHGLSSPRPKYETIIYTR